MQQVSRIFIKGMVCQRCIQVVKSELEQIGLIIIGAELGEVTILNYSAASGTDLIEQRIRPLGFQLLEGKKIKTVRVVKDLVAEVYSGSFDFPHNFRFSDLVIDRMSKEYDAISALFTLLEHKTLERYIIDFRIEKVKELLVYTSMTLADISFKLNYSGVAHLSRQFKQNTGLTPSYFKAVKRSRINIEFSDN
jgi:AraC family transcriptional regulator